MPPHSMDIDAAIQPAASERSLGGVETLDEANRGELGIHNRQVQSVEVEPVVPESRLPRKGRLTAEGETPPVFNDGATWPGSRRARASGAHRSELRRASPRI